MSASFGDIATYLSPMLTAANSYSGSFVGTGEIFLSLAFVLEFFNLVIGFWGRGGAQEFVAKFVRLLMVTSIPLAMLIGGAGSWSTMTGYITHYFQSEAGSQLGFSGSGPAAISSAINTVFNSYANVITTIQNTKASGAAPAANSTATVVACYAPTMDASGNPIAWTTPDGVPNAQGVCPNSDKKVTIPSSQLQQNQASQSSGIFGIGSMIDNASHTVMAFLESVIVAGVLGLCFLILMVALVFSMYGPLMMMSLGVIFGPLLVAWLPFEPLSDLAMKWLKFMLSMGVSFLVGLVLAKIASASLDLYASSITAAAGSSDSLMAGLMGLLPACVAMLFSAHLLMETESIGTALVGGSSIGAGSSFAAFVAGKAIGAAKATRSSSKGSSPSSSNASQAGAQAGGQSGQGVQNQNSSASNAGSPSASTASNGGSQSQASLSNSAASASSTPSPSAQTATAGGATASGSGGSGAATPTSSRGAATKMASKAFNAATGLASSQSAGAKAARYMALGASVAAGPAGVAAVAATVGGLRAANGVKNLMESRAASKGASGKPSGSGQQPSQQSPQAPGPSTAQASPQAPAASNATSEKPRSDLDRIREKIQGRKTRLEARR